MRFQLMSKRPVRPAAKLMPIPLNSFSPDTFFRTSPRTNFSMSGQNVGHSSDNGGVGPGEHTDRPDRQAGTDRPFVPPPSPGIGPPPSSAFLSRRGRRIGGLFASADCDSSPSTSATSSGGDSTPPSAQSSPGTASAALFTNSSCGIRRLPSGGSDAGRDFVASLKSSRLGIAAARKTLADAAPVEPSDIAGLAAGMEKMRSPSKLSALVPGVLRPAGVAAGAAGHADSMYTGGGHPSHADSDVEMPPSDASDRLPPNAPLPSRLRRLSSRVSGRDRAPPLHAVQQHLPSPPRSRWYIRR